MQYEYVNDDLHNTCNVSSVGVDSINISNSNITRNECYEVYSTYAFPESINDNWNAKFYNGIEKFA